MSDLVQLDKELLIGKGNVREVYRHPVDPDSCIKIIVNDKRRRSARRETLYLRLYALLGKPFDHLPRYLGGCRTSLGSGKLFQLVRDYDGEISTPLSKHVAGQVDSPLAAREVCQLLYQLYQHLRKHRIIVSDPAPHNLLLQYLRPDKRRLVVVDGIGNPHFIKIADVSAYFARAALAKKWRYYVTTNSSLAKTFAEAGVDAERFFHAED